MFLPTTSLVLSSDLTTDMTDGFTGVMPLSPVPAEKKKRLRRFQNASFYPNYAVYHVSDKSSIALNKNLWLVCY